MTRLVVNSGICGFNTEVSAQRCDDKKILITLGSPCEMVQELAEEVAELQSMAAAFTGFASNPVYKAAAKCLRHVACPVPSGILKALEVEADLCLPKDVSIVFIK